MVLKIKKLTKVIVPDKWKDGARNTIGGKDGGIKVGSKSTDTNKSSSRLVDRKHTASSSRYNPLAKTIKQCRICKTNLSTQGHYYCQKCAYKQGICAMCGRKVTNTKGYKMSS